MAQPPPPAEQFTRLEVELEFVQCLANPLYLNYLAQSQYFENPAFIAYLEYLEYFRQPEYTKLLTYPSYSLNALSLLKQPAFRNDIMNPHIAKVMVDDGIAGVTALIAQQRGRENAIGGEAEGAGSGAGSGAASGENEQPADGEMAKTNGRG